jgi:hypothetical protein
MNLYCLLSLIIADQLLNTDQNETPNESYGLVEGAVYDGKCADIDEIINNYMTNYEVERTGKREGYSDCLIRKGVIKPTVYSKDEEENKKNSDKLMKIYMADLFRLSLQTVQGRAMLRQFFQSEPDLVKVYKGLYQDVMPDFDEKLAEIIS